MLLRVSPPHFAGFHQHFSPQICLAFTHKPVTSHVLNIRHFFDRTQFTQHETRPWVVCHVTQLETKTPAPRTHPPCKPDDSSTDTNQRTQPHTSNWGLTQKSRTNHARRWQFSRSIQFNCFVCLSTHSASSEEKKKKVEFFNTTAKKLDKIAVPTADGSEVNTDTQTVLGVPSEEEALRCVWERRERIKRKRQNRKAWVCLWRQRTSFLFCTASGFFIRVWM